MHDFAVPQERDPEDFVQWLTLGILDYGVIEFLASYKIDRRAFAQRLLRQDSNVRANKTDLDVWIRFFDCASQANIAREAGCAGE